MISISSCILCIIVSWLKNIKVFCTSVSLAFAVFVSENNTFLYIMKISQCRFRAIVLVTWYPTYAAIQNFKAYSSKSLHKKHYKLKSSSSEIDKTLQSVAASSGYRTKNIFYLQIFQVYVALPSVTVSRLLDTKKYHSCCTSQFLKWVSDSRLLKCLLEYWLTFIIILGLFIRTKSTSCMNSIDFW